MLRTFQGNPVVLPLPARGRLHFLILLVHQEVFHRQGAGFPHRALGSRQEDVGLPRGAEGAAALLVAEGRARLLQVLAVGGAHLQLPSEVLVHPLAKPVARRAAPAVTADEGPAGRRRVAGVGGIGAPGQEVGIGGCPLDAAVGELAPLACVHVLRARETRREAKSLVEAQTEPKIHRSQHTSPHWRCLTAFSSRPTPGGEVTVGRPSSTA